MAYPISRQPKVSVPYSYQLGPQETFEVRSISATWDGTSAAGSFIPCVSVYAQDGSLLGRFKGDAAVPVGDTSTEGTFAPFLNRQGLGSVTPPPTPLGTLIAWYDYSDASTLTIDGSGKISAIADKSGNGHTASQATAARRPGTTTVNGIGAGAFTSANTTCLSTPLFGVTYAQPITIALVVTQTVPGGGSYWPGFFAGPAGASLYHLYVHHNENYVVMQVAGGGHIDTGAMVPFTQTLFVCRFNGASSYLRVNGGQINGSVSIATFQQVVMGTQYDGQIAPGEIDFMDGACCEFMYFSGSLSTSQLTATEAYLKSKWGTP